MVGMSGVKARGMELGVIAQYIQVSLTKDYTEKGYEVDLDAFFRDKIYAPFISENSIHGLTLEIHEEGEWNLENKKFIIRVYKNGEEIKPCKSPFKELGKNFCRLVIFGY